MINPIGRLLTVASCIAATAIFATTQPAISGSGVTSLSAPPVRTSTVTRIPSISIDRLPPEASETIQLIERGGRFPYRQDGTVFGNRERRLPIAPYRTYHEYTVPTPGLQTRGARRIIAAPQHVYYYTGDHYRSFQQVVR
jgi:ribonuclease T1